MSTGNGTFVAASSTSTPFEDNPHLVDLDGDGTADLTEIDQNGHILWRKGIPGQPGAFEPPVVINQGTPSRDIAIVKRQGREVIASVDDVTDEVIIYAFVDGGFAAVDALKTGPLPAQVIAANLLGLGDEDIVVRNAGDGTASIFLAEGDGSYQELPRLEIGVGASDIEADDVEGSGVDNLIVTNQVEGDVRVFPNLVGAPSSTTSVQSDEDGTLFGQPAIYQAGMGPYGVTEDEDGSEDLASNEGTAGVAVGTFESGGKKGLVVIDPGSNTLAILDGLGGGSFANARVFQTESPGEIVETADLAGSGIDDLLVLTASGLDVYMGDGNGGFSATPEHVDVHSDPTGMTVADANGDGKLDVLIGNAYGDDLILLGNGDGTFRPLVSGNKGVALAVTDLNGDGKPDFIFADQGLDQVSIQYGDGNSTILAGADQGLLEPGAVTVQDFKIDGVSRPYLIVADSGSNDVLVYPGLGDGQFGPALNDGKGFYTGANPVGVTVADVNGDGLPDLVVSDEGSNDVSILLGTIDATGALTFVPGPRLNAGPGPVSTVVETLPGNPNPDLLVSDSQSNDVRLLPGVGDGFFNDQKPTVIPVGSDPGPLFVGDFGGRAGELDLVTVNAGSNDLTFIADFMDTGSVAESIGSGGLEPVAAISFAIDGSEGLLVANEGDGELALFLGGIDGLKLSDMQPSPEPNPTALALDPLSGGLLQFYVGTAGVERASLVAFDLGGGGTDGGVLAAPAPPVASLPLAPSLQPLGGSSAGSSLALVATILGVTVEAVSTETQIVAEAEVAVATGAAVVGLPNQVTPTTGTSGPLAGLAEPPDREAETPSGSAAAPSALSPLGRFLYRLEDAIEKARIKAGGADHGPDGPPGAIAPDPDAIDDVLDNWSEASLPEADSLVTKNLAGFVEGSSRMRGIMVESIVVPGIANDHLDYSEDLPPSPRLAAATVALVIAAGTFHHETTRRPRLWIRRPGA